MGQCELIFDEKSYIPLGFHQVQEILVHELIVIAVCITRIIHVFEFMDHDIQLPSTQREAELLHAVLETRTAQFTC